MDQPCDVLISFLGAGAGDCALLQFEGGRFNVLVDAGPRYPSRDALHRLGQLKQLLPGGVIDLAVVTHQDDDHIGGFMTLLAEDSDLQIKELIFNSHDLVRAFLEESDTSRVSARQGYMLAKAKRPCHHQVVRAGERLKCYDAKIELLFVSPSPEAFKRFGHLTEPPISCSEPIAPRPPFRPYAQLRLDPDAFKEDTSGNNCMSLAFELRFKGNAWLFLGDAWPSTVNAGLEALYGRSRPHYRLVKVSHHASQGNTNAALLSRFSCHDFVIPTDGSRHPDEQVFRRILDAAGAAQPRLHFPEETAYLRALLRNYGEWIRYPERGCLLQFKYEELHGYSDDHETD